MIICKSTAFTLWHRCAGVWSIAVFLIAMELGIIELAGDMDVVAWGWFLAVWVTVPAVLRGAGSIFGDSNRVLYNAILFGLFGCLPSLAALAMGGALIFILAGADAIPASTRAAVLACAALAAVLEFIHIRRRLIDSRFVERSFRVHQSVVLVKRDLVFPKNPNSPLKKIDKWITPFLGVIVPTIAGSVYFFQAGLTMAFGELAVPLLISCITLPWAVHATAQYLGGIYLWVYRTWQVEAKYKLPVEFEALFDEIGEAA